jgi:hypothetical protein
VKCRIGDRALVVRSSVPGNVGLLVEVLAPWPGERGSWRVRSLCGPRPGDDGRLHLEARAVDSALRPIRAGERRGGARSKRAARTAVQQCLAL